MLTIRSRVAYPAQQPKQAKPALQFENHNLAYLGDPVKIAGELRPRDLSDAHRGEDSEMTSHTLHGSAHSLDSDLAPSELGRITFTGGMKKVSWY